MLTLGHLIIVARVAQLVEREAFNLKAVGSSPTSGGCFARSLPLGFVYFTNY